MSQIKAIREGLAGKELDGILLLSERDCRYATGFFCSDSAVVITKNKAFLFTDSRYIEAAAEAVTDAKVCLVSGKKRLRDWIKQTVEEEKVEKLGIEEDSMSVAEAERYGAFLAPVQLRPAQDILKTLRAAKTEAELESMISAQRIAERAFEELLPLIRPGVTERELMAELVYRMLKYGSEGNSFDPIVITGKRTSMPHGVPGDTVVQSGDFVTMDFGCIKNGYCSDMTRTVAVGSVTDEMRRVYDTVLAAQKAGISAAKAGVPGMLIDNAARAVIENAGYGEYFGHSFGHSLGLKIHESPNAAPSETTLMPKGAVISAEPGIYLPGRFGVRIEDVLYLTETGSINITKAPKELIIL